MKIRGDMLKISTGALNVKGEKLEPEQQVVRREVTVDVTAKLGAGAVGKNVGSIPATIVTDTAAIDTATSFRHLCGNCKFFRNDQWIRDLKAADSPGAPIERRRAVNQIRAALLQTQSNNVADASASSDGDLDLEHALHSLGYCYALFEYFKGLGKPNEEAMTLVHPASCCPEDVRSQAAPHGFFTPRDAQAEAQGSKNFDSIMQRAQVKK